MNLILTIAIGEDYERMSKLTHPSIKSYAHKINADYLCIDKTNLSETSPHWEKFQIYDLLDKYDRIIYFDTDLIIRDDCENLFEIVPDGELGMFNEAPFTNRSMELMIDICKKYGITLPDWNGKYYNSGVMVISKTHQKLFKKPEKEYFSFYEQSYLNMMIAHLKIKVFNLRYIYNRMTCMDAFTGEERHASKIIHYAGYPNLEFVIDLIGKDIERWHDALGNYEYDRHLYISVNGGLGDQICAEPALRYLIKQYPNDEIVIASHFPRIFSHLDATIIQHGKANLRMDTPYWIRSSLPGPDTINWAIVSHLLCHTVDYCSIALLKRTLPFADRQINFEVALSDYNKVFDLAGTSDIKDFTVIHPGKHWNSKTLPSEYWQKIINNFKGKGPVAVIGKSEPGDPPDYIAGARGTVDIDPEGTLDLREKLSLGELGALLSTANILISNDSAPIHLAGAFDNWIYIIPTCKHPDHVLPYRNGSVFYKTKSFYKRLIIDDVESRPTQVEQTSAEVENIDWNNYLVPAEDIISEV
jgi:ADP-heptose:LPS heptosyltransferase